MDDHEITLSLKWRPTWPDRENDFVAEAPGYDGTVGRIYLQHGESWFWAMNAHGPEVSRNAGSLSGYEPSPRRAALAVEESWAAAIRGSVHDAPQPAPNSYAAAKARW